MIEIKEDEFSKDLREFCEKHNSVADFNIETQRYEIIPFVRNRKNLPDIFKVLCI
jgi:hypothetical protein